MTRLETTHQTVRCPLEDCIADLSVRSDRRAAPSARHRAVIACSLRSSMLVSPLARRGYLPDVAPPVSYEVGGAPCQAPEITCGRHCIAVLNAAEAGAVEPPLCTSGDALELARLTQTAAMMRVLWSYSGG